MDELIKELNKFWPTVTSIILISFLGIFYKKLKTSTKSFIGIINKNIAEHKQRKALALKSCPFEFSIIDKLNKIEIELRPNGGSSLRDAINRIDKNITAVSNRLHIMQASSDLVSDVTNICRWAADSKGKIIFVNRPCKKLIGAVDDEAILGEAWISNVVHIDDRQSTTTEWLRAVEAKSEYHHTFRAVNLSNGNIIKVTSHAKVILDDHGKVLGWAGVVIPADQKNNT